MPELRQASVLNHRDPPVVQGLRTVADDSVPEAGLEFVRQRRVQREPEKPLSARLYRSLPPVGQRSEQVTAVETLPPARSSRRFFRALVQPGVNQSPAGLPAAHRPQRHHHQPGAVRGRHPACAETEVPALEMNVLLPARLVFAGLLLVHRMTASASPDQDCLLAASQRPQSADPGNS